MGGSDICIQIEHGHGQQQHYTVYAHILTDAAYREEGTPFSTNDPDFDDRQI